MILTCGGTSGLVTGLLFMYFWIRFKMMPAMLYMYVLDQMKLITLIGQTFGLSRNFVLNTTHYITAVFLGMLFGLLFYRLIKSVWNGVGIGFLFGIIWWILTPFYLMPFFFVISPNSQMKDLTMFELLNSLLSHIIFGILLGFLFTIFRNLYRKWMKHE